MSPLCARSSRVKHSAASGNRLRAPCGRRRAAVASRAVAVDAPGAARDELVVEYEGLHEGRQCVRGELVLAVPSSSVYEAVTDFTAAPDIFTNVATSRVTREGTPAEVTQECKWRFLMFKGLFKLVIDVAAAPETQGVDFSLVESQFMRQFKGAWRIEEAGPASCKVVYSLQIEPAVSPPPAFAHYTAKIFVKQARNVLEDLEAAVLASAAR